MALLEKDLSQKELTTAAVVQLFVEGWPEGGRLHFSQFYIGRRPVPSPEENCLIRQILACFYHR